MKKLVFYSLLIFINFLFCYSGNSLAQVNTVSPLLGFYPLPPAQFPLRGGIPNFAPPYPTPVIVPSPIAPPMPSLFPPPTLLRHAAQTTAILPTVAPTILGPTSILASLLFSPLPATTTVTNTAVNPGPTGATAFVPNNVTANTTQNFATTVTTTPVLPGLTAFLPLLLLI
ncbi:MAG: hypothetical protein ACMUIP_03740 [bacterium]